MIVLTSNFLNHHMLPLCLELDRLTGHQFRFVATATTPREQRELCYKDNYEEYPFVVPAYRDRQTRAQARRLCRDCEVLIYGSTPYAFYAGRLLRRRFSFRYSESVLKTPTTPLNFPKRALKYLLRDAFMQFKEHYLLSASAYAPESFARIGAFRGRCLRFGYFTPFAPRPVEPLLDGKRPGSILWAGRMIPLKKPLLAVETAEKLRESGAAFHMDIVGAGELFDAVCRAVESRGLSDCVTVHRAMPNEELRARMDESEIYLFTSNSEEGWGAVLNEAMSSACGVIAYEKIGSVPYLLADGENGLLFKKHDAEELAGLCRRLLEDGAFRRTLGRRAYETIAGEWNAAVAAERLLRFVESGETAEHGPLSRA